METEASKVSDCSKCLALVACHHTLCSILYHQKLMTLCNVKNGIHFTGNSGIMYHGNCLGLLGYRILNQGFINVHGIRTDVYEHNPGTAQYKGICGRYKRIGRHDHLIVFLNITKKGCHFQCMGTGCCQKALTRSGLFLNPPAAFPGKITIPTDMHALYGLLHIIHFLPCKGRHIKSDHFSLLLYWIIPSNLNCYTNTAYFSFSKTIWYSFTVIKSRIALSFCSQTESSSTIPFSCKSSTCAMISSEKITSGRFSCVIV